uniref:(northern house mosquito) hypothetical protein n=1 Tax=Culex pipiens TaxID=7175 RepID=A0A8D8H7J5_CULPI
MLGRTGLSDRNVRPDGVSTHATGGAQGNCKTHLRSRQLGSQRRVEYGRASLLPRRRKGLQADWSTVRKGSVHAGRAHQAVQEDGCREETCHHRNRQGTVLGGSARARQRSRRRGGRRYCRPSHGAAGRGHPRRT